MKVLVIGRNGFIGSHVVDALIERGHSVNATNLRIDNNLPDLSHYDHIVNCAGWNGGIRYNELWAPEIFAANSVAPIQLYSHLIKTGFKGKVISLMASCAYNGNYDVIPADANLLDGVPHPSVECHGYAKRSAYLMGSFAREKRNLDVRFLCPGTVFGPRDSIDPDRTKVLMALIIKFVNAIHNRDEYVNIWGTGKAVREFVYVEDIAHKIVEEIEAQEPGVLLKQVPGIRCSIRSLVTQISMTLGYKGNLIYDYTKSDGQPRKYFETSTEGIIPPSRIMNTALWYANTQGYSL